MLFAICCPSSVREISSVVLGFGDISSVFICVFRNFARFRFTSRLIISSWAFIIAIDFARRSSSRLSRVSVLLCSFSCWLMIAFVIAETLR